MIYWAPLLHFYQPPTQWPRVLERIANECYRPLVRLFREHPNARATVNINGSLTELLHTHHLRDVYKGLSELAARGQIELVGSAKYHTIQPLIPDSEQRRQIALNWDTNRHFMGKVFAPRGFFPPEMCYSADIVGPIASSGHRWLIVSGIACPTAWPTDVIHRVRSNEGELAVFFRDDLLSNRISFRSIDGPGFLTHLRGLGNGHDRYVITAMDAETFGHHLLRWEDEFLATVYRTLREPEPAPVPTTGEGEIVEEHAELIEMAAASAQVEVVTISQLLEFFPAGEVVEPHASSWSTDGGDLAHGNPYPLWISPGNEMHDLQWQHTNICIELTHQALALATEGEALRLANIARELLDRALYSCQYWWASRRPMWDINLIHKGLLEQQETLLNAMRAIELSGADADTRRGAYYRALAARSLAGRMGDILMRGLAHRVAD